MLARTALAFVLVISGCDSEKSNSIPTIWTPESVAGLCMDLIDSVYIEQLSFGKEGHVTVEVGTVGGPITAPAYPWRIVNGALQIGDGPSAEQLTLVSRTESRIVVRKRAGDVHEYRICNR